MKQLKATEVGLSHSFSVFFSKLSPSFNSWDEFDELTLQGISERCFLKKVFLFMSAVGNFSHSTMQLVPDGYWQNHGLIEFKRFVSQYTTI